MVKSFPPWRSPLSAPRTASQPWNTSTASVTARCKRGRGRMALWNKRRRIPRRLGILRALEALFPRSAERRRRLAVWLAWLALALGVFLVARALHKHGGVMELNRAFGRRFLAHEDPWLDPARGLRVHGPYPPSLAWVAVPLALLPELWARGLWACAQLGALAALLALLRRRAREDFPAAAEHVPLL